MRRRKLFDPLYQTKYRYLITQRCGNRGRPIGEVYALNTDTVVTGRKKGLECERRRAAK